MHRNNEDTTECIINEFCQLEWFAIKYRKRTGFALSIQKTKNRVKPKLIAACMHAFSRARCYFDMFLPQGLIGSFCGLHLL